MIEQKLFALGNACMEHNQTGLIFVWISSDTLHACYLQRPYIQYVHTYTDQVRYVYHARTLIELPNGIPTVLHPTYVYAIIR